MKLKSLVMSFFLGLFFVSCDKKEENLPLSDEKIVDVLCDIHLAEGAFQNMASSAKDTLSFLYYEQIYEIHGVEKNLVDSCIKVLNRNPQKFFEIYEKVEEKLAKDNEEMRKNRPKNRNLPKAGEEKKDKKEK